MEDEYDEHIEIDLCSRCTTDFNVMLEASHAIGDEGPLQLPARAIFDLCPDCQATLQRKVWEYLSH